jgi:hypothetical protein
MSLVRPLRMVSIFPERHRPRHLRPRLRPVELNPCKAGPICTHLVLIIGCPVWIRVGDAEMRRQPRYTTSFRNAYGPLPNSHSLRHLLLHLHLHRPTPYPQDRRHLHYRGHSLYPHNAFPDRQYQNPSLTASGQIGFRCRQLTTYKRILSSIACLERFYVMVSTVRLKRRLKETMRKSLMILVRVVAIRFYGLNGEGCLGS